MRELAAKGRIADVGAAASTEKASPWEDGSVESFNGKLRDELPGREVFDSPREARVLIERRRQHCNTARARSALGYRPPAPEAAMPMFPMPPPRPGPAGPAQPSSVMLHQNPARTTRWGLATTLGANRDSPLGTRGFCYWGMANPQSVTGLGDSRSPLVAAISPVGLAQQRGPLLDAEPRRRAGRRSAHGRVMPHRRPG